MRCPVDGTTLALAERAGVEIDYCPQCRGVWLDRGELDRIVEHSARGGHDRDDDHDRHDDHERRHHGDHGRRYHDHDEYPGDRYDQPRRKRGGAFGALSDLLGGGGD